MKRQIETIDFMLSPTRDFWGVPISEITDSIKSIYISDSYNSLSIEGYTVTKELIVKIRSNNWDPGTESKDLKTVDALATKGYNQAFNGVIDIIVAVYKTGKEQLDVHATIKNLVTKVHADLFSPMALAGIVKPVDVAGFRKGPIYIRGSRHVPPASEYLMDCMGALYDLINTEQCYYTSALLGHLCLGFIHPFGDGNGRTSRFLMSTLLIVSGHDWVVIPVWLRDEYIAALDSAYVNKDIIPFAKFLSNLSKH
jgi:Fic family protein